MAIIIAVAITYFPALGFPYLWTDHAEIEEGLLVPKNGSELVDMLVQSKGSAKTPEREMYRSSDPGRYYAYYRPVKAISYGIDHAIGGGQPWMFHLTNLLIHAGTAILLLLLARRLFGPSQPFLAEALALWHVISPLHTEAAVWISARSDSLWGLFLLGALLVRSRIACALLVLLALGSKESGLVSVAILVLFANSFKSRSLLAAIKDNWLPLAAALGYLAFRLLIVSDINLGALGGRSGLGFWTISHLMGKNLLQSFIPWGMTVADTVEVLSGPSLLAVMGLGLAIAWLLIGWRFRKTRPVILFGALGWLVCILPVSQLVPLLHPRGDRYLYVPALFSQLTLAYTVYVLFSKVESRTIRQVVLAVLMLVFIMMATIAHLRAGPWSDERTLFARAVADHPQCSECWNNLAFAEATRGNYPLAVTASLRGIAVDRKRFAGARDGFSLRFILVNSLLIQDRGSQATPWIQEIILHMGPTPANLELLARAQVQTGGNRVLIALLLMQEAVRQASPKAKHEYRQKLRSLASHLQGPQLLPLWMF